MEDSKDIEYLQSIRNAVNVKLATTWVERRNAQNIPRGKHDDLINTLAEVLHKCDLPVNSLHSVQRELQDVHKHIGEAQQSAENAAEDLALKLNRAIGSALRLKAVCEASVFTAYRQQRESFKTVAIFGNTILEKLKQMLVNQDTTANVELGQGSAKLLRDSNQFRDDFMKLINRFNGHVPMDSLHIIEGLITLGRRELKVSRSKGIADPTRNDALARFAVYAQARLSKSEKDRYPEVFLIRWATVSDWATKKLGKRCLKQAVCDDPFRLRIVLWYLRANFTLKKDNTAHNTVNFRVYGPSLEACLDTRVLSLERYIASVRAGKDTAPKVDEKEIALEVYEKEKGLGLLLWGEPTLENECSLWQHYRTEYNSYFNLKTDSEQNASQCLKAPTTASSPPTREMEHLDKISQRVS